LTAAVEFAVASCTGEVDSIVHPMQTTLPGYYLAELVCHLMYGHSLTAVAQHLGHERQVFQLPFVVQRREDFPSTENLDYISGTKPGHSSRRVGCNLHLQTS
jgi:hypothetical protein